MCHTCANLTEYATSIEPQIGSMSYALPSNITIDGYTLFNTSDVSVLETHFGPWNETTFLGWHGLAWQSDECAEGEGLCDQSKPFAFSCSLRPCVQTYAANVSNNVYTETELLDSRQYLHYNPQQRIYELAADRTVSNGTWKNCTASDQESSTHSVQLFGPEIQHVLYQQSTAGVKSSWYEPSCVYNMTGQTILNNSTQAFWSDMFFQDANLQYSSPSSSIGPTWLISLWNRGRMNMTSINAHAAGIADSLGGYMRSHAVGPEDSRAAVGQAWETDICIGVKWGFMSYLAIVLILELIFFGAVVGINYFSAWGSDWKSSTLAVVFRGGLAEPGEKEHTESSRQSDARQKELKDVARGMKIKLVEGDNGWRLMQQG